VSARGGSLDVMRFLARGRQQTDFAHNLPLNQWWLKLRPLLRLLSQHESSYETEAVEGDDPAPTRAD